MAKHFWQCNTPHTCHCGTGPSGGHIIGKDGCKRRMEKAPTAWEGGWLVCGHVITDFTLRQQRGYRQHECGCWSSWNESKNSVEA